MSRPELRELPQHRRAARRAPGITVTIAFALALLAAATARPALAHQTSMKQLEVRVAEPRIELLLRASVDDAASAIGRDAPQVSRAEVLADAALIPVVTSWVQLAAGAAASSCTPTAEDPARAEADRDARFVTVRWSLVCPAPITALTLDLATFFALDATHTMVVHLEGQGGALDTVVGVDDSPLQLRLTEPEHSFVRWMRLGMSHIFGGADHVCFVITLLLAAVITRPPRAPGAAPGPWRVRSARQTLRATALLITSFSLAHSLTLIAASLGWVAVPVRVVESVIAASIAYAAAENALRPDAPWRWGLTFGFGLVHGLGFASSLAELLPTDRVVLPLLAFNLGVEVGQLIIVAAGVPLLLGLARLLRAHRYRAWLLPATSVLLGSLALLWSIERAFEVTFW